MGNIARKTVLVAAVALFALWFRFHVDKIVGDPDGTIRLVLGSLFGLLIVLRPKAADSVSSFPGWAVPFCGVVGALLAILGIIFSVHQFEWLGLILVVYACLRWGLNEKSGPDVFLALFLVYWVHPLPGQVFGRFQLAMQEMSIKGAAWLLHCANARVWADGFFLRTGLRVYGVPESCSGMRTSVTVLLCTLGVGMLFRFKWYEIAVFLVLGVVQVLVLNIMRIAWMVYLTKGATAEAATAFLHDTLGLLLLISILIVQIEASWWKAWSGTRRRRIEGIKRGELERPDKASMLPGFWRVALKFGWIAPAFLLVAGAFAFAVYKSRPEHKAAMIMEVAEGLMETDVEAAERAVEAALELMPDDREVMFQKIHVLILRRKFEQALSLLDKLPGDLNSLEAVMKSWALQALGRIDEAYAVVKSLPASARATPGVAMLVAEYGATKDIPEVVSSNVMIAAGSHLNVNRIRALFPYLAAREQWQTVAASDRDMPYKDASEALIALEANLKTGNLAGIKRVLGRAIETWPDNPRFLDSLVTIAAAYPGSEWEDHFAANLTANLYGLSADQLAGSVSDSFRIGRPDLAWLAYLKLSSLDPEDPALDLLPARFADIWLDFRRHDLGVEASSVHARIDLGGLFPQTRNVEPFRSFWNLVPLAREMVETPVETVRKRRLNRGLAELARREESGRLSRRMKMSYPSALAMAGRYAEAHARLDALGAQYPERTPEILFQHAVYFMEEAKWEHLYETMLKYRSLVDLPTVQSTEMMCTALMNMDLGFCAIETAERAIDVLHESQEIKTLIASMWDAFGAKEQALFILEGCKGETGSRAYIDLLYDTGRIRAAERLSRLNGIAIDPAGSRVAQDLEPVPAEIAVVKRWPIPLSESDMKRGAEHAGRAAGEAVSPFVRRLRELESRWYEMRGSERASDVETWRAAGRNDMEKAAALNSLSILLARKQDYARAAKAAMSAIELMPRSAILRRLLINLTSGDAAVVTAARSACPDDPDIWLASLVVRTATATDAEWAVDEMHSAIAKKNTSVGTLVRAGDLFLRNGMSEPAAIAAREALVRSEGLIPAFALGFRVAMAMSDFDWALTCIRGGIENALDPSYFYKGLVEVKSRQGNEDADLFSALEYLHERFAEEPEWGQRLGQLYFRNGHTKRALNVLRGMIERDITKLKVESVVLAAEAARMEGQSGDAIAMMERAHASFSDNLMVLNNLVYSVAQEERSISRARELLPRLLSLDSDSIAVLDTAAIVEMRSGRLDVAWGYMEKALKRIDEGEYSAPEIILNAVDLLLRMEDVAGAEERIKTIVIDSTGPAMLQRRIRELRKKIEEAKSEGK